MAAGKRAADREDRKRRTRASPSPERSRIRHRGERASPSPDRSRTPRRDRKSSRHYDRAPPSSERSRTPRWDRESSWHDDRASTSPERSGTRRRDRESRASPSSERSRAPRQDRKSSRRYDRPPPSPERLARQYRLHKEMESSGSSPSEDGSRSRTRSPVRVQRHLHGGRQRRHRQHASDRATEKAGAGPEDHEIWCTNRLVPITLSPQRSSSPEQASSSLGLAASSKISTEPAAAPSKIFTVPATTPSKISTEPAPPRYVHHKQSASDMIKKDGWLALALNNMDVLPIEDCRLINADFRNVKDSPKDIEQIPNETEKNHLSQCEISNILCGHCVLLCRCEKSTSKKLCNHGLQLTICKIVPGGHEYAYFTTKDGCKITQGVNKCVQRVHQKGLCFACELSTDKFYLTADKKIRVAEVSFDKHSIQGSNRDYVGSAQVIRSLFPPEPDTPAPIRELTALMKKQGNKKENLIREHIAQKSSIRRTVSYTKIHKKFRTVLTRNRKAVQGVIEAIEKLDCCRRWKSKAEANTFLRAVLHHKDKITKKEVVYEDDVTGLLRFARNVIEHLMDRDYQLLQIGREL